MQESINTTASIGDSVVIYDYPGDAPKITVAFSAQTWFPTAGKGSSCPRTPDSLRPMPLIHSVWREWDDIKILGYVVCPSVGTSVCVYVEH